MTPLTDDERRTVRLLFSAELTSGTVAEADIVDVPEVRSAVRTMRIPSLPERIVQAYRRKTGRLDPTHMATAPAVRARRAVLGSAADGPPRVLVRMDEYPHWRAEYAPDRYGDAVFGQWRDIMAEAGCSHLIAIVPRIADDPMQATGHSRHLTDLEVDRLHQLSADGVVFGLHGYDHRTRYRYPRLHTELGGRSPGELGTLLDRALVALRNRTGIEPQILVPPFNTFSARQYPTLASRFRVITGGPESILWIGFHAGPAWRDGAVYLPAYAPLYDTAANVIPALERQIEDGTALWTPIVLHWGWEADRGWKDLKRLAKLVAPYAAPWNEFLKAVEMSR